VDVLEHAERLIGPMSGGGDGCLRSVRSRQGDRNGLLLVLVEPVAADELKLEASKLAVAHTVQAFENSIEIALANGMWLKEESFVEDGG
jgi:hypothetical protein